MSSVLRFGVIGCGEISAQTCEGINAAPNTSIAVLMDERPEVLADLAEFYGVPTTTSIGDVLSNPEVDAVYVATPHYTHMPIGVAAARAGKHVLMEKPIAITLADADAIINACQQNSVKLGVAFYAQVDAAIAAARDLVRAGVLGDVMSIRLSTLANKPESYWTGGYTQRVHTTWRTIKAQAGGGVLMMNLIHDLNTVRWVTGLEATRVYAEYDTLNTDVEVEDTIGVLVRYENQAIGVLHGGSTFRGGAHEDIRGPRIYGTKGQTHPGRPAPHLSAGATRGRHAQYLAPGPLQRPPIRSPTDRLPLCSGGDGWQGAARHGTGWPQGSGDRSGRLSFRGATPPDRATSAGITKETSRGVGRAAPGGSQRVVSLCPSDDQHKLALKLALRQLGTDRRERPTVHRFEHLGEIVRQGSGTVAKDL